MRTPCARLANGRAAPLGTAHMRAPRAHVCTPPLAANFIRYTVQRMGGNAPRAKKSTVASSFAPAYVVSPLLLPIRASNFFLRSQDWNDFDFWWPITKKQKIFLAAQCKAAEKRLEKLTLNFASGRKSFLKGNVEGVAKDMLPFIRQIFNGDAADPPPDHEVRGAGMPLRGASGVVMLDYADTETVTAIWKAAFEDRHLWPRDRKFKCDKAAGRFRQHLHATDSRRQLEAIAPPAPLKPLD